MPEPETPVDPVDDERRFVEQALLALDGYLGPEGEAELRARLAEDVEKRRLFVRLCLQTQALSEVLHPRRWGDLPDEAGPEALELQPAALEGGAASPRPVRHRGRATRRSWLPWAITSAACILSLLTIGWVAWRRSPGGPGPSPAATVAGQDRKGPEGGGRRDVAGFDDLAMVINLDGARWDPSEGPPPAAGDILGAGRLRLRTGRATLAFLSGVTLTLEGPADLNLVSIDRVFCRQGRLRAHVPAGAEGFVVASPGSAVVDMGTEFGLNVEADGRSHVMVFEGKAEAALLNTAGSPERTQLVERSMAFELDPQARRIVADGARPDGFVSAPELSVPPLDLGPAYAAAVLRSRPRGYWRFESLAGRAVPNEVPGGEQLRLNGPVGVAGASTGNGCALFHAGEPEQFLFSDGLWEMTREPGHAVEFWFASEGISHASLVGLFPPKDYLTRDQNGRHIHTFLVELTAHDRGSLFKPASIRFLHRWPLDTRIGNNAVSEGLYVPRRWHHVVAQKNGGRMELFHDGALDRTMSLGPDHPTLSCRLVVGRRTPDPLDAHDARPFVGRLDELAIYDHPLSADEVLAHFRLANAGPPSE